MSSLKSKINPVRRKRLYDEHVRVLENVSIRPLVWEEFKRVYREYNHDDLVLSKAVKAVKEKRIAHRWLDQT